MMDGVPSKVNVLFVDSVLSLVNILGRKVSKSCVDFLIVLGRCPILGQYSWKESVQILRRFPYCSWKVSNPWSIFLEGKCPNLASISLLFLEGVQSLVNILGRKVSKSCVDFLIVLGRCPILDHWHQNCKRIGWVHRVSA